ncbi:MAG: ribonuclease Z [Ruminococcus sp.]|jgi:ribonuclease Z|nr:ribonuclease Z [Ruminococcus sp.]
MLDVILGGTGGMMPLPKRFLTTLYVELEGAAFLIDCGEGTQIALKKTDCHLSSIDLLMITHFHADHIAGLPGLLLSLANSGKTSKLTIFGPRGLRRIVESLTVICRDLPFKLEINELDTKDPAEFKWNNFTINALPLRHKIACFGYFAEFKRKPIFNPKKAEALGVPLKFYRVLHSGESVTLENGETITTQMVTDGKRDSVKISYVTDTLPFSAIADFAYGSDLFICEGMYADDEMKSKMQDKHHMLFSDAAKLAKEAEVKELWLTHFSPALVNPKENILEIKKIFENTVIPYDGYSKTLL